MSSEWLPPSRAYPTERQNTPPPVESAPPDGPPHVSAPPPSAAPPPTSFTPPAYPAPLARGASSGKATASLIMGIIGIFVLPVIFSVLAIAFAMSARREIERNPHISGRGNATAGLALGIIGLAIWAILLVALLWRG